MKRFVILVVAFLVGCVVAGCEVPADAGHYGYGHYGSYYTAGAYVETVHAEPYFWTPIRTGIHTMRVNRLHRIATRRAYYAAPTVAYVQPVACCCEPAAAVIVVPD